MKLPQNGQQSFNNDGNSAETLAWVEEESIHASSSSEESSQISNGKEVESRNFPSSSKSHRRRDEKGSSPSSEASSKMLNGTSSSVGSEAAVSSSSVERSLSNKELPPYFATKTPSKKSSDFPDEFYVDSFPDQPKNSAGKSKKEDGITDHVEKKNEDPCLMPSFQNAKSESGSNALEDDKRTFTTLQYHVDHEPVSNEDELTNALKKSASYYNDIKEIENLINASGYPIEKINKHSKEPLKVPKPTMLTNTSTNDRNGKRFHFLNIRLSLSQKQIMRQLEIEQSVRPTSLPRRQHYKRPQDKEMGRYPQSLKLIGVEIPEDTSSYNPNSSRAPRSTSSLSWQDTPAKVQTRVRRRSTSLDDVKRVIPQIRHPEKLRNLFLEPFQRSVLSQAIYEEWCEKKEKDINEKRVKEKIEAESKLKLKEFEKLEREERNQQIFVEWKQRKEIMVKEKRTNQQEEKIRKKEEEREKAEKKESDAWRYYEVWKEQKNEVNHAQIKEQIKKLVEEKNQEERGKRDKLGKKNEAEKSFEAWAKAKNENLRREIIKVHKEKLRKEEEEKERRETAELAYQAWKRKKAQDERQKLGDLFRLGKEGSNPQETGDQLEIGKSPIPYHQWLDELDGREDLRHERLANEVINVSFRPPWNPGGGSSSPSKIKN